MFHHALALGHRELPEQEKPLAGRGRDPVGIAAAGVQESGLRRLRCRFREIDKFVLDLERAQRLKLLQRQNIGHDLFLIFRGIVSTGSPSKGY